MPNHDSNLDNIVPRFGSLANARVTPVVLIGVWTIFLPVTIGAAGFVVSNWSQTSDIITSLLASIAPLFVLAIGAAILWQTTWRYVHRPSNNVKSGDSPGSPT